MKKEHPKNGLHTEHFENGQKCLEGYYKNGKRDGKWTRWHENGQKEQEGNHNDDKQDVK